MNKTIEAFEKPGRSLYQFTRLGLRFEIGPEVVSTSRGKLVPLRGSFLFRGDDQSTYTSAE
jgi:hypothetical protein